MTQGQFLSGVKLIWIQFSFFLISYLTKALKKIQFALFGRRNRFMPFLWALVQSEMETASSRIWTWDTNSISYVDNHYT